MTQFVENTMFGRQSKYWGNISLNIWPGKWRWTPGRKTVNISLSTRRRVQAGGWPDLYLHFWSEKTQRIPILASITFNPFLDFFLDFFPFPLYIDKEGGMILMTSGCLAGQLISCCPTKYVPCILVDKDKLSCVHMECQPPTSWLLKTEQLQIELEICIRKRFTLQLEQLFSHQFGRFWV